MSTNYETAADYADAAIYRAKKQSDETMRAQAAEALKAKYPSLEVGSGAVIAAKNLRKLLKAAFPGTKFSVRSDRFSGGNSIRVEWTDGPTADQVDEIANRFEAGTFDGQTDCYNYAPDAWNQTFGSTKYMTTRREYSDALVARAIEELKAEYPADSYPSVDDYNRGRLWYSSPVIGSGYGGLYCWQSLIAKRCSEMSGEATGRG